MGNESIESRVDYLTFTHDGDAQAIQAERVIQTSRHYLEGLQGSVQVLDEFENDAHRIWAYHIEGATVLIDDTNPFYGDPEVKIEIYGEENQRKVIKRELQELSGELE